MTYVAAETAMPQIDAAYDRGVADGLAMKYPGETRENIIRKVIEELDTTRMTQELMLETALSRAMELYVTSMSFAPDLQPDVQQDTHPELLASDATSEVFDGDDPFGIVRATDVAIARRREAARTQG